MQKLIENQAEPMTKERIKADLVQLGVKKGMILCSFIFIINRLGKRRRCSRHTSIDGNLNRRGDTDYAGTNVRAF